MPFIPHSPEDTAAMLKRIGAASIDDLFIDIPKCPLLLHRKIAACRNLPDGSCHSAQDPRCPESVDTSENKNRQKKDTEDQTDNGLPACKSCRIQIHRYL